MHLFDFSFGFSLSFGFSFDFSFDFSFGFSVDFYDFFVGCFVFEFHLPFLFGWVLRDLQVPIAEINHQSEKFSRQRFYKAIKLKGRLFRSDEMKEMKEKKWNERERKLKESHHPNPSDF